MVTDLNEDFKSDSNATANDAGHRLETEHAAQALALVHTLLG